MRIIHAREKHGDRFIAAEDNEQLAKASLMLLRERWEEGWYYEPDDPVELLTDEEIEALPEYLRSSVHRANIQARAEEKQTEDYRKFYNCVKALMEMPEDEAITQDYSMFTGRIHFVERNGKREIGSPFEKVPLAWYLLHYRRDAKYEWVDLEEIEEPSVEVPA